MYQTPPPTSRRILSLQTLPIVGRRYGSMLGFGLCVSYGIIGIFILEISAAYFDSLALAFIVGLFLGMFLGAVGAVVGAMQGYFLGKILVTNSSSKKSFLLTSFLISGCVCMLWGCCIAATIASGNTRLEPLGVILLFIAPIILYISAMLWLSTRLYGLRMQLSSANKQLGPAIPPPRRSE